MKTFLKTAAAILAQGAVAWALVAFGRTQRVGASLLGVALCAALAVVSAQRVGDFRSPLALWTHDLEQPGEHYARYVNMGSALGGVSRFEEAVAAGLPTDRVGAFATELISAGNYVEAAQLRLKY